VNKTINCPCGNNIQFEYEAEIDLDKNPDTLESILNGTFMSCTCPFCRKKHKPELNVNISWASKNCNLSVFPELERGEFYIKKKDTSPFETVIGFPEMADRIAVIKDSLEPVVIETLKSYILAKAEENYPDNDVSIWYYCKSSSGIEFHINGLREEETAVMRIPEEMYNKTLEDFKKQPKKPAYASLRVRSYLSIHNLLRSDVLK